MPNDPLGTALLAAIVLLIAALAVTYRAPAAAAHVPNPVACKIAWHDAEPGSKHAARIECQAMQYRHRLAHACRPPRPVVRAGVTVKGARANTHQRKMLTRALNEGRRLRVPRSHQIAVVAGMVTESEATNLTYGDRDSVGILQLRAMHEPDGVGMDWRLVPENSAGWFYRGAHKLDPRGRAPLASNRRTGRWGLIQRVQRSGLPYAYNRHLPEARRTVRVFLGACPA